MLVNGVHAVKKTDNKLKRHICLALRFMSQGMCACIWFETRSRFET